jgi:hypothetical protein
MILAVGSTGQRRRLAHDTELEAGLMVKNRRLDSRFRTGSWLTIQN